MSEIRALLLAANVVRALIVDDAYDSVPLASDLTLDADEWTQFFDDLNANDVATLREIYPRYEEVRADELPSVDEFVASLWSHRSRLRTELIDPLFARYTRDTGTDLAYLATLQQRLGEFGLACETAGRQFKEKAVTSDLIVIDLFLGSTQDEGAVTASIDGLCEVISGRADNPPLVLLMSRNTGLADRREEFRDRTGLFESAFRIIRKTDLADPGKLQRLLTRLARHYADSLKLAAFLSAWNAGINQARKRSACLIRKLDLADYGQIRQLLLSAEGEPTGSYLVDVFDLVLHHEIEGEASIIDSAIALNALTSATYPPPYVEGSRDLQDLVYRSLFQHRERLRLIGAENSRVAFGDLLRRKTAPSVVQGSVTQDLRMPLSDILEEDILAVLTPACDLQRHSAKRVLLMVGKLKRLQPAEWSYGDDQLRTPVVELLGVERSWIKWDLKHIETIAHRELEELLAADNGFEIVARMRESHALELQQKLLASLGRVGLIAVMPATFPVRVEVYLPDLESKLRRLDVPVLEEFGGVCYVGRPGPGDMRLVLSEEACEAICDIIGSYDLSLVHRRAHEAVNHIRGSSDLLEVLERGVSLPSPQQQGFKDIAGPVGATSGVGQGASANIIGLVMRNGDTTKALKGGEIKKAGVVIATWDEH